MPARRRHFERAFGRGLPAHVAEIQSPFIFGGEKVTASVTEQRGGGGLLADAVRILINLEHRGALGGDTCTGSLACDESSCSCKVPPT